MMHRYPFVKFIAGVINLTVECALIIRGVFACVVSRATCATKAMMDLATTGGMSCLSARRRVHTLTLLQSVIPASPFCCDYVMRLKKRLKFASMEQA